MKVQRLLFLLQLLSSYRDAVPGFEWLAYGRQYSSLAKYTGEAS